MGVVGVEDSEGFQGCLGVLLSPASGRSGPGEPVEGGCSIGRLNSATCREPG